MKAVTTGWTCEQNTWTFWNKFSGKTEEKMEGYSDNWKGSNLGLDGEKKKKKPFWIKPVGKNRSKITDTMVTNSLR